MNKSDDTQNPTGADPGLESRSRRLTRSREDRYVGGVAAGLAGYFSIDPLLVRVAFLVSLAIGGVGVLAYLVLLALVPLEGDPDVPAPPVTGARRNLAIGGTVLVGVLLLFASVSGGSGTTWLFGFGPGVVFGVLMWVVAVAALIWALTRAGTFGGLGGGPSATPAVPPQTAAVPPPAPAPAPTVFAPSPSQTATTELSNEAPTEVQQPALPNAPSTFGRIMTWIAIAFAGLVVLSIVAIVSFGITALFGAIPAAVVVVLCGIGVVWLALSDRPQIALWIAAAAVAIAIPMAVVSIASLGVEGDWGEIKERPTSAFEIPVDGYRMAAGALKVDLRGYPFRKGQTVDLSTDSGFGATTVIVPDDVCVVGNIEGKAGYIDMRSSESEGIEPHRSLPMPVANVPVLRLDSQFRLGYFGVFDNSGWRVKHQRGFNSLDVLDDRPRVAAVERASTACAATAGSPATG